MATAVFNQLNSVDATTTAETTVYNLGTTTAGVDKVQFNSIRLVNHGATTIFVSVWSISGGGATSDADLLVSNFAIPPDDWRDVVDTKVLSHTVAGSLVVVQSDTINSLNVIVNGMEITD
jgi:hypothetical protein